MGGRTGGSPNPVGVPQLPKYRDFLLALDRRYAGLSYSTRTQEWRRSKIFTRRMKSERNQIPPFEYQMTLYLTLSIRFLFFKFRRFLLFFHFLVVQYFLSLCCSRSWSWRRIIFLISPPMGRWKVAINIYIGQLFPWSIPFTMTWIFYRAGSNLL